MRAIIAGSTGLIGQHLTEILCDDQTIEVAHSLTRRKLVNPSSKLNVHITDFASGWNERAPRLTADIGFCCLGTTMKQAGSRQAFQNVDLKLVTEFALFCHQSQVKHFLLVSAMGANAHSVFFYNRVKGQCENAVQRLGFEQVSILRPSLLLGRKNSQRRGEQLAEQWMRRLDPIFIGPFKNIKAIEARDVARAMRHLVRFSDPGVHIYTSAKIQELSDRERQLSL